MIDIPEPLRAITTRLHAARQAGDAAAIAALYTEDALIILPGGQHLAGRAQIAQHYRDAAPQRNPAGRKAAASGEPSTRFHFYPPLVHALATVNGRHGEKHSMIDVYQQQADASYALVFSSWTMR